MAGELAEAEARAAPELLALKRGLQEWRTALEEYVEDYSDADDDDE